jgi:predicted RNase H-like HicB family nuclease
VKYAVVFEQTPRNWAAYVPDLPGCVATGPSREDVERLIREGIALHLESMREAGEAIPVATTVVGLVEAP